MADRCDPYTDPIPEIPAEMIAKTAQVYADAFAAITGAGFVQDVAGESVLARVRGTLSRWFV